MKLKEIYKLKEKHEKKVKLSCDDYHAHSYERDCFRGNKEDLLIIKLCVSYIQLHDKLEKVINES